MKDGEIDNGQKEAKWFSKHGLHKLRVEMSDHIPSTEGNERELGSSNRQLNFKLQALSPFCFCPSLHPSSSFISICITLLLFPSRCWVSPQLSNISSWFSSVPKSFPGADQVSLPRLLRDWMRCRRYKVTELTSITRNFKPQILSLFQQGNPIAFSPMVQRFLHFLEIKCIMHLKSEKHITTFLFLVNTQESLTLLSDAFEGLEFFIQKAA